MAPPKCEGPPSGDSRIDSPKAKRFPANFDHREYIQDIQARQASFIARRFRIEPALATVIAALAFAEGRP